MKGQPALSDQLTNSEGVPCIIAPFAGAHAGARAGGTERLIVIDALRDDEDPIEDESGWSVRHFLAALATLALIALVLLAVLYYLFQSRRSNRRSSAERKARSQISWLIWYAVALVVIILFVGVTAAVATTALHVIERSKLFVPTHVARYSRVGGKWYPLPGGGGLLHYTPNADPRSRPVLFAHGNTLGLDPYASALDRFSTCGYNIWALEYAGGYGMTMPSENAPCGASLLRDMREAWAICGRSDAIIIGFSMGGALLGQAYDDLAPAPAQIVFLNTFWSVPDLVSTKAGFFGPLIAPLLETQWITKPPRYYNGRVVIVWSRDDDIVDPSHSSELCSIFSDLRPTCIELPKGGHRWSAFCFMSSWCNSEILLPP